MELNVRHCHDSTGVRDHATLRSQLHRPESNSYGQDVFEGIWEKAAVLVHGVASTQTFHNGNKRTAWLACLLFLIANGYDVEDLPVVDAEVFVRAVAANAVDVSKAAEWLETHSFPLMGG
ncbi:type II toxin-antitoxin system death-on-curing family toxin [Microbacterium sp. che218]|uniref:type II toxin-antitoxin system death-on-curing family toxin n=1 Tax=Microbacterium sp. che218 TaxID=3140649 RepID=UPI00336C0C83